MSATEQIRKYVVQHYGNLISIVEPRFDARNGIWLAELKSDYPRIIRDDRRPDERMIRFLSLRRLGTVMLSEDLQSFDCTPRETCIQNLSAFLDIWHERAERIIVRASSEHLARIDEARWVLAKVGMIVSNLLQNEMISDEDLAFYVPRDRHRMGRYLKLLEGLDLVSRTDGGYTYGPLFAELRTRITDPEEFEIVALSHVIRERYSTLRESFGISQLETFVHVDSCYYRPALEAESLIYRTRSSIVSHYGRFYGQKPPLRIAYILGKLVHAKALEYEDGYYFGNEHLFSQMLDMKSEMAELAPSRA